MGHLALNFLRQESGKQSMPRKRLAYTPNPNSFLEVLLGKKF